MKNRKRIRKRTSRRAKPRTTRKSLVEAEAKLTKAQELFIELPSAPALSEFVYVRRAAYRSVVSHIRDRDCRTLMAQPNFDPDKMFLNIGSRRKHFAKEPQKSTGFGPSGGWRMTLWRPGALGADLRSTLTTYVAIRFSLESSAHSFECGRGT